MTRQKPDSKLKKQDDRKPAKGQSKWGLEMERGANDGDMRPASGFNGTLNNMPTQPAKFAEFSRQLAPLMPFYRSIELACVAARHDLEWILITGKAVLSTGPCASGAQLIPVVDGGQILALRGCIPAGGVNNPVANLRDSWVVRDRKGIKVRLTAERASGYKWWKPRVIKSRNPSSLWSRALALDGDGPDPSSFLSDSTMNQIDSQLQLTTSRYDGFDDLCRELGLPARRNSLTLSFQLSAELPANISSVNGEGSNWTPEIAFNCLGKPDLKVEWYPKPVLEGIPATSWVRGPSNDAYRAPLQVLHGAYAANLILSFGELEADVATVELSPLYTGDYSDGEPISFKVIHQVPKDDEDIAEHRKNQELVKGKDELIPREVMQKEPPMPDLATREAPTGIGKHRKDDGDIAEHREIQELPKGEKGLALLRDGQLSRASRVLVADILGACPRINSPDVESIS